MRKVRVKRLLSEGGFAHVYKVSLWILLRGVFFFSRFVQYYSSRVCRRTMFSTCFQRWITHDYSRKDKAKGNNNKKQTYWRTVDCQDYNSFYWTTVASTFASLTNIPQKTNTEGEKKKAESKSIHEGQLPSLPYSCVTCCLLQSPFHRSAVCVAFALTP